LVEAPIFTVGAGGLCIYYVDFRPLGQLSNGLTASLCIRGASCSFRSHISETVEDLFI